MNAGDLGRLVLRGIVGGTMIAHGVKQCRSPEGTARWFGSIGFRQPARQARTSAVVEIGSGAALVVGAGTPPAVAAGLGLRGSAARPATLWRRPA